MNNLRIKLPKETIKQYGEMIKDLEKKANEFNEAINNFNDVSKHIKLKVKTKWIESIDPKSICNDCIFKDDDEIGCKFNKGKYHKVTLCGKYIEVEK